MIRKIPLYLLILLASLLICVLSYSIQLRRKEFYSRINNNPQLIEEENWNESEFYEIFYGKEFVRTPRSIRISFWDKSTWKFAPPIQDGLAELERRKISNEKINLLINLVDFHSPDFSDLEGDVSSYSIQTLSSHLEILSVEQRREFVLKLSKLLKSYVTSEENDPANCLYNDSPIFELFIACRNLSNSIFLKDLRKFHAVLQKNYGSDPHSTIKALKVEIDDTIKKLNDPLSRPK